MIKFIKNIAVFLFITLISICIVSILYITNIERKISRWKLEDNITTVFMGDSHIRLSIDDQQIHNSKNLGHESETYYFTFYKLIKLLENNNKIDKVYLGYNYHNLSNYTDILLSDELIKVSPDYFFLLPIKDRFRILYKTIRDLPSYARTVVERNKSYSFEGGFVNKYSAESIRVKEMDYRISGQFFIENKLRNLSEYNQKYLYKIIELCKEKKVDLVLLQTPIHPYYLSKVPDCFKSQYSTVLNNTNLEFIDLSCLIMPDDFYVLGGDHVSEKGVYLTTIELIHTIEKK